ncbi:NADPH oxidase activator 1 [Phascolarctos cinereus]|uniref:NADPH oxidase activator 1 n=1 Tax=Phascolarctos cinereus TaxID=38626 RepID=A0A6P5JV93_PHACI|nr:NADPH oxidase activator 1 [Phascolarctos cinereus]
MSYRGLVKGWHEAVQALDREEWDLALELFSRIKEPSSKICFNMSCVLLLTGNPEAALQALDQTVTKDSCLAVGFFLRGMVHFQLERFPEALSDYVQALVNLRNNTFIDYKQLGLRYKLQAWEVLYNMAAVQCQLGLWEEATKCLEKAISKRPEGSSATLEAALDRIQKRTFLDLLQFPKREIFRPRKKDVEQLNSMDFLGKPKVISSVNPNDKYTGFEPLRPQRIHWPVSPMEPVNPLKVDKLEGHNGIPCPPTKGPPKRPHLNQAGEPVSPLQGLPPSEGIILGSTICPETSVPSAQGEVSSNPDTSVNLRVHCTFTVTLDVKRGASVPVLRNMLRDKLLQRLEGAQLSYSHQDNGKFITISGEEACKKMWQEAAADRRLSLQCQGTECRGGRRVLYQMVAQYSYSAEGPEDLEFQKGDTLDILSEVNEEWLEGHCSGHIGIFPKCFAQLASVTKEETPVEPSMTYSF